MKIQHPWEIHHDALPFVQEIAPNEKKSIADPGTLVLSCVICPGKKNACLSADHA